MKQEPFRARARSLFSMVDGTAAAREIEVRAERAEPIGDGLDTLFPMERQRLGEAEPHVGERLAVLAKIWREAPERSPVDAARWQAFPVADLECPRCGVPAAPQDVGIVRWRADCHGCHRAFSLPPARTRLVEATTSAGVRLTWRADDATRFRTARWVLPAFMAPFVVAMVQRPEAWLISGVLAVALLVTTLVVSRLRRSHGHRTRARDPRPPLRGAEPRSRHAEPRRPLPRPRLGGSTGADGADPRHVARGGGARRPPDPPRGAPRPIAARLPGVANRSRAVSAPAG